MFRVAKGIKIKCGVLVASLIMTTGWNAVSVFAEGEGAYPEESGNVYVEETWEETSEAPAEEWTESPAEEWTESPAEESGEWIEEATEETETWTEEVTEESGEVWQEESFDESQEWTEESQEGDFSEEDQEDPEEDEEEGTLAPSNGEPIIVGNAGLVYCRTTGEIVFAKNIDTKYSPYSITKILTVLLAAQRLLPNQEVTISAEAASQGGASMDLIEGEVVTVEDLLYGTMLLSGNDAAYALGEAVSGDMKSFIQLMNDTVKGIGCKNTHFESPSGLINDVTRHYTTCKDMLEIAKVVFSNNMVKQIGGTKKYEMAATNYSDARTIETHIDLLEKPGYVAGKTGWWVEPDEATIVMDYEKEGLEFIAVVMGSTSKDRSADCDKMINYANKVVEGIKAVKKGDFAGKVRIRHGAVTTIDSFINEESLVYLPKQGSKNLITQEIEIRTDVEAPVKKGDSVGTCKIFVAGDQVDEVDVVAGESVEVGWFPSYVGISNKNTMIIMAVIGVILLLILLSMVHRLKKKRQQRIERRHKIREMAREEMLREERRNRRY